MFNKGAENLTDTMGAVGISPALRTLCEHKYWTESPKPETTWGEQRVSDGSLSQGA